jgi:hypothetical protein
MALPQLSLRSLLWLVLVCGVTLAYVSNYRRMRIAESELKRLRVEIGFLESTHPDELAAVRVPADEPLMWQARVRVPAKQRYRVAYSAVWRESTSRPDWFAAQQLPEGESVVTIRVMKDPRDDQWRISTIVRHSGGTQRIGTVLPDELSAVFRGSHDVFSGGIGKDTVVRPAGEKLRIFDERYFSGSSLLLYGDRAPEADVVGVFAELQPDTGPL